MRIALFTPFSPDIGGGSVQIREIVNELADLNIDWHYLARTATGGARRHWLGPPLTDLEIAWDLLARFGAMPGSRSAVCRIVDNLHADLFWVVGHRDGVSVAAELIRRGQRVHLTVHDDPICMFRRSRRYRLLTPFMARQFSKIIKAARSVDVIGSNMRDLYAKKYHIASFPVYRYIPELPKFARNLRPNTLTVGHIGSVYHPEPLRLFLLACQSYAEQSGRAFKVVRIGTSPELDLVADRQPEMFENHGELEEAQALPLLASCDFVYAMYPPGTKFKCFRRTSLPMKLSTYIQAQRPIFAHTPNDSGLADIVSKFGIGEVCCSNRIEDIRRHVDRLVNLQIEPGQFEQVRRDLLGKQQVEQLRTHLGVP